MNNFDTGAVRIDLKHYTVRVLASVLGHAIKIGACHRQGGLESWRAAVIFPPYKSMNQVVRRRFGVLRFHTQAECEKKQEQFHFGAELVDMIGKADPELIRETF
jgi:hypothetical protein